jgi:hypothetical protein
MLKKERESPSARSIAQNLVRYSRVELIQGELLEIVEDLNIIRKHFKYCDALLNTQKAETDCLFRFSESTIRLSAHLRPRRFLATRIA